MRLAYRLPVFALIAFLTCLAPAFAATPVSDQAREAQEDAVYDKAMKAATPGPATVPMGNLATIKLPADYIFIPADEAAALMLVMGNNTNQTFMGLVTSKEDTLDWFVTIDYTPSGHVDDEDAKSWKAKDLLDDLKEGTAASNKARRDQGIAPLEIVGWAEEPHYDPATQRLVWAMEARDEGDSSGESDIINYNIYALGRSGYFELDLVTGKADLAKDKQHAAALLSALSFTDGNRYADFNAKTDKVAEYGLAALVAGLVAHKAGFFALAGVFIAKFFKFLILVPLLFARKLKRLFGKDTPADGPDDGAPPAAPLS